MNRATDAAPASPASAAAPPRDATGPWSPVPPRKRGLVLLAHRAARFVTSLSGAPPSPVDEAWVDDHLLAGERQLWVRLSNQDRRHSILVARRFVERRPGASRAEIAGALLHDVGKVDCGLGTSARVVATLTGPVTERFRIYHDHERIGAELCAAAGSAPATVELVAGGGPGFGDLLSSDHA